MQEPSVFLQGAQTYGEWQGKMEETTVVNAFDKNQLSDR